MISCSAFSLAALLTSLLCAAFGRRVDVQSSAAESTASAVQECWDHLIYLAADNNLESAAVSDMEELVGNPHFSRGVKDYHARLLVERSRRTDRQRGFTGASIPGIGFEPKTNTFATLDPGANPRQGFTARRDLSTKQKPLVNPENFRDFLQKSLRLSSGCNTFLTLWDHGMGPFGFGSSDDFDQHAMTVTQMADVLGGVLGGRKLTMLGFDACLMSSYEVLQSLSPFAEFVLSSEETEPGHGWDYSTFNPSGSATEVGRDIIDGFMSHSYQQPKTLALVNSNGFMNFAKVVDFLCDRLAVHLKAGLADAKKFVGRARQKANTFKSGADSSGQAGSNVDLGQFLEQLKEQLPELWQDERKLLDKAINIYKGQDSTYRLFEYHKSSTGGYTGMSVFFPDGASSFGMGGGGFDQQVQQFLSGLGGGGIMGLLGNVLGHGHGRNGSLMQLDSATAMGVHPRLQPYLRGMGSLGAWSNMVDAYLNFREDSGAVYKSYHGQTAPRPSAAQPSHATPVQSEQEVLIKVHKLINAPDKEIVFYGVASESIVGLEVFYGKVNDGHLKIAGTSRPDLRHVTLQGAPYFVWWVDFFGFAAYFKVLRNMPNCDEQTRRRECWWLPQVMVLEENQNNLHQPDAPELVKIPIEFYPDDNTDDGLCEGRGFHGHMVAELQTSGETVNGWSVYIQVGGGFSSVPPSQGGSLRPQEMTMTLPSPGVPAVGPAYVYPSSQCVLWSTAHSLPLVLDKEAKRNPTFTSIFRVETSTGGPPKDVMVTCECTPEGCTCPKEAQ